MCEILSYDDRVPFQIFEPAFKKRVQDIRSRRFEFGNNALHDDATIVDSRRQEDRLVERGRHRGDTVDRGSLIGKRSIV